MIEKLKSLAAADPAYFLKQIYAQSAGREEHAIPSLRIQASDGLHCQGKIINLTETSQGLLVLMAQEGHMRSSPPEALTYMRLFGNFSVSVLNPLDYLSLLKMGKVEKWSDDEALSSLALKRAMEEFAVRLKTLNLNLSCSDAVVTGQGDANNVVRDVIAALVEWVERTVADQVGREAIEKLKVIDVSNSSAGGIDCQLAGDCLKVGINTTADIGSRNDFFEKLDSLF